LSALVDVVGALVDVDQSNDSSGVVVECFDVCLSIKHATA